VRSVVFVLGLTTSTAVADDGLYDRLWPQTPRLQRLGFGRQLTLELAELGNQLGHHLDLLSRETIRLRVDGATRTAHLTVGGDTRYLTLALAHDIQFTEGLARIRTRFDVQLANRRLALELPTIDVVPGSSKAALFEIRLPIIRRRW
jgi:hypothetical protein